MHPEHGHVKPDLSRDQAFMVDPKAIKWIVREADLTKEDRVLEIGAGTGNLTKVLARTKARIIAVESDISFENALRKRLKGHSNVDIIMGNGLKVLDSKGAGFTKLVSNIPYAISEPLIRRLIFSDLKLVVITLPKSFARKLIAAPWEKDYSMLSFIFQRFFIIQGCLDLQRDSFKPEPRSNSVVMKFESKPKDSVFCQMFLRPDMVTRNALREAICSAKNKTKNQARSIINSLDLTDLLEKKVSELNVTDIKMIVSKAAEFREE